MKKIINSVISSFTVKFNVKTYLSQSFYKESYHGKAYYLMDAEKAKVLLEKLKSKALPESKIKTHGMLARMSDTGRFNAPKYPILIDAKKNEIIDGANRLHALTLTHRPSVVWVDFV